MHLKLYQCLAILTGSDQLAPVCPPLLHAGPRLRVAHHLFDPSKENVIVLRDKERGKQGQDRLKGRGARRYVIYGGTVLDDGPI